MTEETTVPTEEITVADVINSQLAMLDLVGNVLDREHKWLQPQVDESRKDRTDMIERGWKDEALCGGLDDLCMHSAEVDKHLTNIRRASEEVNRVSAALRQMFELAGVK